jgi:hypothetical protein
VISDVDQLYPWTLRVVENVCMCLLLQYLIQKEGNDSGLATPQEGRESLRNTLKLRPIGVFSRLMICMYRKFFTTVNLQQRGVVESDLAFF